MLASGWFVLSVMVIAGTTTLQDDCSVGCMGMRR